MAADNINSIIDPSVMPDLQALVDKLVVVEGEITAINGKNLNIRIEGIESINALTDAIQKQQISIDSTNKAINDNRQATAQLAQVNETYGVEVVNTAVSAGRASAEIRKLTNELRDLQAIQQKAPPTSKAYQELGVHIQDVTTKISTLTKQLPQTTTQINNVTNSINILGISGDKVENMLARMIIRNIEFILVLAPAIAAVSMLTDSILENIKGTDKWLEKQNKMIEGNKMLIDSFKELTNELLEQRDAQNTVYEGFENSIDGAKRNEAAIKAMGITSGAVYEAESKQADARVNTLIEEKKLIDQKNEILQRNFDILSKGAKEANEYIGNPAVISASAGGDPQKNKNVQYDLFSKLAGSIDKSDIAQDFKESIINKMNKAYQDGSDILKVYSAALRQSEVDLKKNQQAALTNTTELDNINTALQAKRSALSYQTALDLTKQRKAINEQLRQSNEKEDVASVDKIVADTTAKYKGLAEEIGRNKEVYRLSMTTKDDVNYTDKNIEAYNNLLKILKEIGEQEKNNLIYEQTKAEYSAYITNNAALSSGNAAIASGNASFGSFSYGGAAAALDANTKAKKDAANSQFQQQASGITDSNQLVEAQRQQDEKLIQIDREAYKARLELANKYFTSIAEKVNAQTYILSNDNKARHFNNLSAILKKGGSGVNQDERAFYENKANEKSEANIQLQGVRQQIPVAQDAYNSADAATKGPLSEQALQEAEKVKQGSLQTLSELKANEAEYANQVMAIDDEIARHKKANQDAIMDSAINLAKETVSAIAEITDNQIAGQQQNLQIQQRQLELNSKQQIATIDATTGFAIEKDNEKAKAEGQNAAKAQELQNQQNQLTLRKARADKTAAEASIIVNTATAIIKAFSDFPFPVAIPIAGILAATGAVQYAAAASAPLPQFEKGGTTTTDTFIAGEKGHELMISPSGNVGLSSANAKVHKAPIGTKIIPADETEKLMKYAAANVGKDGGYNAMQALYNNHVIMEQVAKIIGDKYMEGADKLETAIYRTAPQTKRDTSVADAIRESNYLKNQA